MPWTRRLIEPGVPMHRMRVNLSRNYGAKPHYYLKPLGDLTRLIHLPEGRIEYSSGLEY